MPRIRGFDDIEAEIAKHPGKLAHDEWANLRSIFTAIYQKNRSELIALLEEPSKNEELSIELFQNVRPQTIKEMYNNEVLRSLFNYLSGLSSLVDTGNRLVRKYDEAQLARYIVLKKKIVDSDINSFFGNLRNYIQHYGIPPLGWEIQINNSGANNCTYYLSNKRLLQWKGWSTKAKTFIGRENVNLIQSITDHGIMIDDAYSTLLSIFPEIHSEDIRNVNELMHRRNDILSGKVRL